MPTPHPRPRPARLILFDIDGTLLSAGEAAFRAVQEACDELFERALEHDRSLYHGSLDPLIWRAICASNGIPDAEHLHARFRALYSQRLGRNLEAGDSQGAGARALPGARELVEALHGPRALEGRVLGLLTGNYPETARVKLEAVGLEWTRFPVGVFGDDAEDRRGLPPVALRRDAELRGRALEPEEVVVIGDTPRDVDCARVNGCRSLAVATGVFDVHALRRAGADLVLEDLGDTAGIVDWLEV